MNLAGDMGDHVIRRKPASDGIHDVPGRKHQKRSGQTKTKQTVSFWGQNCKCNCTQGNGKKAGSNEVLLVKGASSAPNLHMEPTPADRADERHRTPTCFGDGEIFDPGSQSHRFDPPQAGAFVLLHLKHTTESNQDVGLVGLHRFEPPLNGSTPRSVAFH